MGRLARILMRLRGWTFEGTAPTEPKFVAIGVPHTSNWDFFSFLAVASHFGFRANFIGKHTLFRWPFGGLMRRLGGIPVRRESGAGLVEQVVEAFRTTPQMALVIAPEGTRKRAPFWRSGFYQIAAAAEVPITLGFVDHPRKRAGLGPLVWPSGDAQADMDVIRRFYQDKIGKHPSHQGPIRLREEDPNPNPGLNPGL